MTISVFEGMDKNTLRQLRKALLETGKLTVELNDAIDQAQDKARAPDTPAQVREWCKWRSATPYTAHEETMGLDDGYAEAVHSSMTWLIDQHPGVCADLIMRDGKLAFYGHASNLFVYSGYGQENALYEVWTEAAMDFEPCDNEAHVALFAKRLGYGKHRLRGEYGVTIGWLEPNTLYAYGDYDEPYEVPWDDSMCDACGRVRP
jgi:hypothetical protein